MLVKIPDRLTKMFAVNPGLKAHHAFNKLKPHEMAFVALVADYFSPIRHVQFDETWNPYPEQEDRIRHEACKYLGWQYIHGNGGLRIKKKGKILAGKEVLAVEEAMIHYKALQSFDTIEMLMKSKELLRDITTTESQTLDAKMKQFSLIERVVKDNKIKMVDDQIAHYFNEIEKFYYPDKTSGEGEMGEMKMIDLSSVTDKLELDSALSEENDALRAEVYKLKQKIKKMENDKLIKAEAEKLAKKIVKDGDIDGKPEDSKGDQDLSDEEQDLLDEIDPDES